MPLATIKVLEGVFSGDEKHRLIQGVTDAIVSVEGEGTRGKTVVIIEEIKSGDWGIGGETLTTNAVMRLRAKK